MALNLEQVLANYNKTQSFDVKIALPIGYSDLDFKNLDAILEGKGMIKRTENKRLPLGSAPIVFRHLEDFIGDVYHFVMEFEYPITSTEIRNEISTIMRLNFNYISVLPVKHPMLKDEENYFKYNENDVLADIIASSNEYSLADGVKFDSNYPSEIAKTLKSKEAKKYQNQFLEVDMNKINEIGKKGSLQ